MAKKVPPKHLYEFLQDQASLIRSRVNLLCLMAVGIYLFATIASYLIAPQDFKPQEIPASLFLIIGGCVILYLNSRSQKLYLIKLNAYLFTALLLLVLTRINIIYYEYIEFSPFVYVFALFLIAFTIPWRAIEVIPL